MNVKVHKLEVYVMDFHHDSPIQDIIDSVENNRHYAVLVKSSASTEINDFTDDHPTNKNDTSTEALRALFK